VGLKTYQHTGMFTGLLRTGRRSRAIRGAQFGNHSNAVPSHSLCSCRSAVVTSCLLRYNTMASPETCSLITLFCATFEVLEEVAGESVLGDTTLSRLLNRDRRFEWLIALLDAEGGSSAVLLSVGSCLAFMEA
jgi:hypothetical protein